MTIRQSTLVCVASQIVLSGIGLVAVQAAPTVALLTTFACATVIAGLAWRLGFIEPTSGSDVDG